MRVMTSTRLSCPVTRYDRAPEGYAESVAEWIANPHAYFVAFGAEARAFQKRHRSERLRTMTLVAEAEKLTAFRPVCLSLDDSSERVTSWAEVFSVATSRLVAACPETFAARFLGYELPRMKNALGSVAKSSAGDA